jgi:hypothetical protein
MEPRTPQRPRDPRLARLSREHHHALVMGLRLERELPRATDAELRLLYADLARFWSAALQQHSLVEADAFLERVAHLGDAGLKHAARLQRHQREHESLIEAMRGARTAGERAEALAAFGRSLCDHVRWQERELFEWIQQTLPNEELDAIGSYLEANLPDEPVPCPMPHDP